MDKAQLFQYVFRQVLDYADDGLVEKCAKWGLDTLKLLEQNGRVLTASDGERGNDFIYAVTTALIVGEFGNFCFNDNSSDEAEIDLGDIGLEFGDIEPYINEDTASERREELRQGNCVNIQDLWSAIGEWKREIRQSLTLTYKDKGKDPNYAIFASLMEIFEVEDEETKEIIAPYANSWGESAAYQYICEGFQY